MVDECVNTLVSNLNPAGAVWRQAQPKFVVRVAGFEAARKFLRASLVGD